MLNQNLITSFPRETKNHKSKNGGQMKYNSSHQCCCVCMYWCALACVGMCCCVGMCVFVGMCVLCWYVLVSLLTTVFRR